MILDPPWEKKLFPNNYNKSLKNLTDAIYLSTSVCLDIVSLHAVML